MSATTKKTEKIRLGAQYFQSDQTDDSAIAALFFSGRPFPASEDVSLQIGGAILGRMVIQLCGDETSRYSAYRKHGDLGSAALDVLPLSDTEAHCLSLAEVQEVFHKIAGSSGAKAKSLLFVATPLGFQMKRPLDKTI